MTVLIPAGTRQVEVPRFLRQEPSLSQEQLVEIARLALSLEETVGHPVDIECAYAGEELYLLHCRPVTT
jgi:pyruvate,water dikinase